MGHAAIRSRALRRCTRPSLLRIACAGLAALFLTSIARPVRGDAPTAGGETRVSLSLEEALARADGHAPEVTMARHALREAEAGRRGAGIVFPENPRLLIAAKPAITGADPVRDLGYGAVLEIPFEAGGAPAARAREAERVASVARAELTVEQLRARTAAWTAYLRAKIEEQRQHELDVSLAIAQRVLAASALRSEVGASSDIERALASAEVAQLEVAIEESARAQRAHTMELRDALDLAASQQLELVTEVQDPPPAPDDRVLIERALASRPELAVIRERILLLDATGERLRRELFPRLGAFLEVDASPLSPVTGIAGVSIELPFAQRQQGRRARVEAARQGELERRELLARRIVRDVLTARDSYDARLRELRHLTDAALPSALRTLELVETGWRAGRFDLFRVTTAARDAARIRGQRLDALEAAWLERIAIHRSIGGTER